MRDDGHGGAAQNGEYAQAKNTYEFMLGQFRDQDASSFLAALPAAQRAPDYWLYVVFDCASSKPWVLRVNDPFGKLFARTKSVVIDAREILAAAEKGE